MFKNEEIKRLEQKIDDLADNLKLILERQNQQYTDIMTYLKDATTDNDIIAIDKRSIERCYDAALKAAIEAGKVSTSFLQRKLNIGYTKAAAIMDLLEERGIIDSTGTSSVKKVIEKK